MKRFIQGQASHFGFFVRQIAKRVLLFNAIPEKPDILTRGIFSGSRSGKTFQMLPDKKDIPGIPGRRQGNKAPLFLFFIQKTFSHKLPQSMTNRGPAQT